MSITVKTGKNKNEDGIEESYNADKYYFGNGVDINKMKAAEFYEKAANKNNTYAQLMLGYMYDFGDGIQENAEKAIKWYEKAANNGDSNAALNLANMYLQGRGIPINMDKGITWLEKSAKAGNGMAASSLGRQYTLGDGVEKSISKAEFWIGKAEQLGYINCGTMTNLGLMYEEDGNLNKAFLCLSKALEADENDTNIHYLYGQYKFFGKGTNKNIDEAKHHIQWVIEQDPNDNEAYDLMSQIQLYEQIHTALDVTKASISNQTYIWDYHLQIIANNYGFFTYIRFSDSESKPFNKSEYWEKFNSIFSLDDEKSSSTAYTYKAIIKYGNNEKINLENLTHTLNLIKEEYEYLSFEQRGDYFVTSWRT